MRNHKKIFEEVKAVFLNMEVENKIDKSRVEIALNELEDIEIKYAPDWECAVMNALVFIGILAGTLSAEKINKVNEEDEILYDELNKVFQVLAKHYVVE